MPEDDSEPVRPDFPSELPAGVTVADLPDEEIELRARFVAEIFDCLTTKLCDFVTAGCPLEESESMMRQITNGLELSLTTFRGAAEWRESREEAVKEAMAGWRVRVANGANGANGVPALLTAALLCEAAIGAQEEFFALVRQNIAALHAMEARGAARSVKPS